MRAWKIALFVLLGFAAPGGAQSPRVVTLWASGRIERFDPTAHLLVIKQGTHEMTFTVRTETRLERGRQPEPPSQLSRDIGQDVRVNYVTVSGARVARLVLLVFVSR